MRFLLFTIYFSLFIIILTGCGDSSRPEDLPKLYPCVILVTQDGKPLPDAVVKLVLQTETAAKYQSVATTSTDGTVTLMTYGFPGVPSGKYKAVVTRNIEDDIVYRTDDAGEKVIVSYNRYKTVEEKFSDVKTTPFEIEITPQSRKEQISFDVGKPVRIKMKGN
jgi:hypothetical protein